MVFNYLCSRGLRLKCEWYYGNNETVVGDLSPLMSYASDVKMMTKLLYLNYAAVKHRSKNNKVGGV